MNTNRESTTDAPLPTEIRVEIRLKQRCLNCRFFGTDIVSGYEAGVCKRHAPQILSGSGTGWSNQNFPVIGQDDWCGEWELDKESRFSDVKHD